jgi:hypothetical protein
MTPVRLILFALTACAASSFGGEIYGTIKEGGKPVAKGLEVTIVLGEKSYAKPTDDYGSYRVFVTETGKCTAQIVFKGQTLSCEIQSYSTSVSCDLVIENINGRYLLRRE